MNFISFSHKNPVVVKNAHDNDNKKTLLSTKALYTWGAESDSDLGVEKNRKKKTQ